MLTQWWHVVAFEKAMNCLHRAMCRVSYHYRCTAMAIEMASNVGAFLIADILFAVVVALVANGTSGLLMERK